MAPTPASRVLGRNPFRTVLGWTRFPAASPVVRSSAIPPRVAQRTGQIAVGASLATSLVLVFLYRELGGPGDQITYYEQAADLIPFHDNYYGPVYFAVLRLVHDVFSLSWFLSGKLVSWLSACAFLYLAYRFLATLLPAHAAWLSLALVALNPTFIGESYSSLTIMFGAVLVLGAICLTLAAPADRPVRWLLPGLVFGIGYLTRFQTLGFFAGGFVGVFLLASTTWRTRLRAGAALLIGAAVPVASWYLFLLLVQGEIPPNYNFVHLTLPLGRFDSFRELGDLIREFGSVSGVLTSEPFVLLKIMRFAVKEFVLFPFYVALPLLFLSAGFLLPGALKTAVDRSAWAPWLCAFLVGLLFTGIGSRRWLHYYTAFLPFTIVLVAHALSAFEESTRPRAARVGWMVLLATTITWSGYRVVTDFQNRYWPEFADARAYLQRTAPNGIVAATAGGLRYEGTYGFTYLQTLVTPNEWHRLVAQLRSAGVTHVVATERHGLDILPGLAVLLRDDTAAFPPGLRRDTLIVGSRRLAILHVLPLEPDSIRPKS